MADFKQQQAANFKTLLDELKDGGKIKSQEDFANMVGVTSVTVANWKSGKHPIKEAHAETINNLFPQYPVSWLMGRTDVRNQYEKMAFALADAWDKKEVRELLLDCLAYLNGWKVEKPEYSHDKMTAVNIKKHSTHYIEEAAKEQFDHYVDLVRGEERIELSLKERQSLITKMVALFEFEITHRF